LLTAGESLYDGIACDDGKKVNVFNPRSSYIKGEPINVKTSQTSVTLELWFKLSQTLIVA
jgi:hypothetical protein